MRRRPWPLSVTRPPPSSTTRELVFRTLAVACILIVTGLGPQAKRIIPPARTAATTAAEVQLAGVPWPTTRSGCVVFTARAARGTGTAGPASVRPSDDAGAIGAAAVGAAAAAA